MGRPYLSLLVLNRVPSWTVGSRIVKYVYCHFCKTCFVDTEIVVLIKIKKKRKKNERSSWIYL